MTERHDPGRRRKKKCDEGRPICRRCAVLGWQCEWPTSEELVDRRHGQVRRHETKSTGSTPVENVTEEQRSFEGGQLCLMSESIAQDALFQDIKPLVSKHFVDKYYGLILLPDCQPKFYWGLFHELQHFVRECRSLQYTVLANSASHIYSIIDSAQMQELALTYHSQALRSLHELLDTDSQLENHNGLLISVMLLYTLGVSPSSRPPSPTAHILGTDWCTAPDQQTTGQIAYFESAGHMKAAVKILKLRELKTAPAITRPFDRVAWESVLFSMFYASMGLWSAEFNENDTFDPDFWLHTEELLAQDNSLSTPTPGVNGPVLGVPIALLKLLLLIRQIRQKREFASVHTLRDLELEVSRWEPYIIAASGAQRSQDQEPDNTPQTEIARDTSSLFAIVVSILTEQISAGDSSATTPSARDPDCWKLRRAMSILRDHRYDDTWSRFFNGTMAVYTLGFFVTRTEDMDLVRGDLQNRWDVTNFGHVVRYRKDLEATWAERGCDDRLKADPSHEYESTPTIHEI